MNPDAHRAAWRVLSRRPLWFLLAGVLLLPACATTNAAKGPSGPATAAAPSGPSSPGAAELSGRWGIEVTAVRLTAAGRMLDFRYRVLDAGAAAPLHARKVHPVLVHEATGTRFGVASSPKTGPLRTSDPPIAGKTYWILFQNPGRIVKAGDRITVEIGEFRAEGLAVE